IAVDDFGQFWLPTQRGLSVFDPEHKTFTNYFEKDGFQPSSRYYREIKTSDGHIWIGGHNGLNRIDPVALMVKNSTIPDVWITGMTIMDSSYSTPDGQIFEKAVSFTDEITLKYWQKDFGFQFVALHYLEPEDNQYSWMLENYDRDWTAPSKTRTASYTNLSPGTYSFRVRGSNADGIWNEEGDFITIIISPPWWATWWFRGMMFLLLAGGVGKYVRDRTNKTRRERERLEAEVQKRTQTIREQADQLQVQADQLKELDEVKTRVYTNITHEFRTPLTVISGMTEMIEGHEQAKRLIRANADQLLNLVNQLLELRKLRSGKLELHPVQADIVPYMTYIIESFRSMAERKRLDLRFESNVEVLEMDYDPEKVLRIVSNLLSNAVKFTPEGGEIVLRVASVNASDQPKVSIAIEDSGIGIPPELVNTIFERFYQVEQGTTRMGEGTGIGLSLCKELVDLMQGEIRVTSTPERGSTFEVLLPVTRNAVKQDMGSIRGLQTKLSLMGSELQPTAIPETDAVPAPDEEQPVVLIVEDNADVVQFIHACVDPLYQVHVARDGEEGVTKAFELVPDIVISDVMMPVKDGFSLCDDLKNDPRTSHIPIVLLTALAEVKSRIAGLKRGADAYIAKPFHKEELLARMENLLEIRRSLKKRYASMQLAPTRDAGVQIEDAFMLKLRHVIEEHLDNPAFSVERLSKLMGVSRAQLHRKLVALSGLSATMTIRQARLSKARTLLLRPDLNISEVAYEVGFADPDYFSRVFHKEVGMTPSDFVREKRLSNS
ncbi:MAG: hybrid sensor histidine kinase/response regulator transcription factor, partial [Saprospiraceae bacterium]|nr:hybrid sensor histidine kinase/response regulator transcription factor [Saprospiraceae bacterium]